MIETNEQDVEEISSKSLHAVYKEYKLTNFKSAFIQDSICSEPDEECPPGGETQFTYFTTQRSVPFHYQLLYKITRSQVNSLDFHKCSSPSN